MANEKIAIVTDSTCDLDQEFIREKGIFILPLKVIYPDKEYLDRVDIQPTEIYSRFPNEIPKTSMPSFGEIIELFKQLKDTGYNKVLSLHVSSGLSGTFEAVKAAAQQISDMDIQVIDSKALSLGLGFLVNQATRLKEAGCIFDEMVHTIKKAQQEIKVFFVVKTLEYLRKGGRIGLIEGALGDLLNVKPIVSINEEGKYYTYAKVRGRKRSLEEMIDIVKGYIGTKTVNLAVMHGDAEEEATEVKEALTSHLDGQVKEVFFGQLGPSMVVHAGPGLIGVSFQVLD